MVGDLKPARIVAWVLGALVVAIVVVLSCILPEARFNVRRQKRARSMFVAVGVIACYDDIHQELPKPVSFNEAGRPMRSWRTDVLTDLPVPAIYPNKDAAWDAPSNTPLTSRPLQDFCFDREDGAIDATSDGTTNIVAITGGGTAFDSNNRLRMRELPNDTILLIEVRRSGIPWAAPGDLDVEHMTQSVTQGTDGRGVHVAFADQQVWYLRRDVPLAELSLFFRIDDAKQFDREAVLGPYVLHRGTW